MRLDYMKAAVRSLSGNTISNAIDARYFPQMGTGIVAQERIPKDTLIFQAHRDLWYSFSADYAKEQAKKQAPQFIQLIEQLVASNPTLFQKSNAMADALFLSTHLLVSYPRVFSNVPNFTLGGVHQSYIESLPHTVNLPLQWRAKRFLELEGCVDAQQTLLQSNKFYIQVHKHLFGSHNSAVSLDEFLWAISILLSRGTSGKNQPLTLVPFFDFFNHTNESDACVQRYDPSSGFSVYTTREYNKGEQLFINYGSHSNLRLLRNYGFTFLSNPHDVLNIPLPKDLQSLEKSEKDELWQKRYQQLQFSDENMSIQNASLAIKMPKVMEVNNDGYIDINSLTWLQILLASPEELKELFSEHAAIGQQIQIPKSLTIKTNKVITELCQRRLNLHQTPLEDDEAFLKTNDAQLANWLRSCLHIRMSEKRTLKKAIANYSK